MKNLIQEFREHVSIRVLVGAIIASNLFIVGCMHAVNQTIGR